MTALYLHRAQIWVSQYFCVTLTPLSQLLSDKAAPSVLLCSGGDLAFAKGFTTFEWNK